MDYMGKERNKVTGNLGEKLAFQYFKLQKYEILETNYTTKLGEIDLIVKQSGILIFVEVKTRSTTEFGLPREAVTSYKQHKIRLVATEYLKKNGLLNAICRFDVVEVLDGKIEHITNAF